MAGTVICSKCGQENDPAETFCGSCGAFLEWSGQQVEVAEPGPPPPAHGQVAAQSELAGLARPRPPDPPRVAQAPQVPQPPLVSPVRSGPSPRSVPPSPADVASAPGVLAAPQRIVAPDPTISCPSCLRPNPIDRTFCHSCGTLLRPKPAEPGRSRRGAGGSGIYRLVSILLLIGIILVGSFLVTRLTTQPHSSGPANPTPSPTKAWSNQPAGLEAGSIGPISWSVDG